MTKYERVVEALEKGKRPSMKVFGNSMRPLIESGSILTFAATNEIKDKYVRLIWMLMVSIRLRPSSGRFQII